MKALVSTISPDNPSEAIQTLLAVIVEHAGGDFVGIQAKMAAKSRNSFLYLADRLRLPSY